MRRIQASCPKDSVCLSIVHLTLWISIVDCWSLQAVQNYQHFPDSENSSEIFETPHFWERTKSNIDFKQWVFNIFGFFEKRTLDIESLPNIRLIRLCVNVDKCVRPLKLFFEISRGGRSWPSCLLKLNTILSVVFIYFACREFCLRTFEWCSAKDFFFKNIWGYFWCTMHEKQKKMSRWNSEKNMTNHSKQQAVVRDLSTVENRFESIHWICVLCSENRQETNGWDPLSNWGAIIDQEAPCIAGGPSEFMAYKESKVPGVRGRIPLHHLLNHKFAIIVSIGSNCTLKISATPPLHREPAYSDPQKTLNIRLVFLFFQLRVNILQEIWAVKNASQKMTFSSSHVHSPNAIGPA